MLRSEVDGHEWTCLKCRSRCDIEDFPTISHYHIFSEKIGELGKCTDIEIDHISLFGKISLMEVAIVTESGIIDKDFYIDIFRDKFIIDLLSAS